MSSSLAYAFSPEPAPAREEVAETAADPEPGLNAEPAADVERAAASEWPAHTEMETGAGPESVGKQMAPPAKATEDDASTEPWA